MASGRTQGTVFLIIGVVLIVGGILIGMNVSDLGERLASYYGQVLVTARIVGFSLMILGAVAVAGGIYHIV
jgi:putative copper export protein